MLFSAPTVMEGLNKIIGCDNAQRVADVVFVHGLDGDAISTWHPKGQPEKFWPQWLGEDAPAIGVWSLGYAVSSSAWRGTTMPLMDRATNALDLLELDGIGSRPVIFVCHSLGGLLIKQMLRHAHDFSNADYKRIAEQTRAIVFLSTPHSGSNIADWISHLGSILRTTVSVEELEAHHPALRNLNLWYRNHSQTPHIKTLVYCEKKPLAGILVVNETSADPGIAGVVPIPMDEDHRSICKPTGRTSQIYRRTLRLVQDILAVPHGPTAPADAAAAREPHAGPNVRPESALLVDADAAFVGPTERGPVEPTPVTSWEEYETTYGAALPVARSFLGYAVRGFFENGGARAWIVRTLGRGAATAIATIPTARAGQALVVHGESPGAWANRLRVQISEGSRVGVRLRVAVSEMNPDPGAEVEPAEDYDNLAYGLRWANNLLARVNERSHLIRLSWLDPGVDLAEPQQGEYGLGGGAEGVLDDAEMYLGPIGETTGPRRGLRALEHVDEAALLCIPDHVHPSLSPEVQTQITEAAVAESEQHLRVVLLTMPNTGSSPQQLRASVNSARAAIYYPWLCVPDADAVNGVLVPPVGHVAGLFARHDAQRGVHAPPVDVSVAGTVGSRGGNLRPLYPLLELSDRDKLKRRGINAIVSDATTSQPSVTTALTTAIDEELQALHIQRFYNYLVRSIRLSLSWTVFEPHTEELRLRITEQVRGFLFRLWEAGALLGTNPQDAFYVSCGPNWEDGSIITLSIAPVVEPVRGARRSLSFQLPAL